MVERGRRSFQESHYCSQSVMTCRAFCLDPIAHGLVVDCKLLRDLAQGSPLFVQAHCLMANILRITISAILRGIVALAVLTLITLVSVDSFASFGLSVPAAAHRTNGFGGVDV